MIAPSGSPGGAISWGRASGSRNYRGAEGVGCAGNVNGAGEEMDRYDLAVIGGGTGGLVAAAGAAMLGAKVILFEREVLGGDCLWTGCVPTKALIRSARIYHAARNGAELGLPALEPRADFGRVMERMRAVQARIEPHDSPERFRGLGVDVVLEDARLVGDRRVRSESRDVEARRILVATGSRSVAPPVEGLEAVGYMTHVDAVRRDEAPESLLILGAGAIGLEFAQIYARFGVAVTVLEMADRILPGEDPEMTAALRVLLEAEGIVIETGVRVERAERASGQKVLHGGDRAFRAEEILVATGRRPNVEDVGLEEAGVEVGRQGIVVDDALRTSRPHIFASGDVTGKHMFTHVADYQSKLVVGNALLPLVKRKADYAAVPWVIYTDPELARVGLTESEARDRHGDSIQVYRFGFDDLDRAIIDGEAHGVVKLVADRRGRLLGAHILAADAGSLIAGPILALREGIKLGSVAQAIFPYPTMPEGVQRAAGALYKAKLDGLGGTLLRRLVRWTGVR